jgi:hypothetical protein
MATKQARMVKTANIGDYTVTIDRPAGFKKNFPTPQGKVEKSYPVDYGYLNELVNPDDNEGLDVFLGANGPHYGRFMKGQNLTGSWQPDERKWYARLTDEQLAAVKDLFTSQSPDLLQDFATFPDEAGFVEDVRQHGQPSLQHKQASSGGSTGLDGTLMETIPVDAFNATVWNDVAMSQSRFGSKSTWGNNEQRLGTPPASAAAIAGILAGAKTLTGKEMVSPWDIAASSAIHGIGGFASGLVAGKILGGLAGLRPESQQQLQRAGLWGGLITGAAQQLFGR